MTAAARALVLRQIVAVQSLEIRKRFLGKRSIPVYLLVLIPLFLFTARMVVLRFLDVSNHGTLAHDRIIYAALFRTLILRFVVYFGCVAMFVPLFRGDILDRSLHYYFLAPLSRTTLTMAKFLSGLTAALVLFNGVTLASWLILHLGWGTSVLLERLFSLDGAIELSAYLLVTSLACIGYGAVFIASGAFFRNPIIPAIVILGWESINALLPATLKKISVIHYLESLCPVAVPPDSGIEILSDPASPWVAVPGILLLAIVLVAGAAWRVRRMEILYGVE